MSLLEVDNQLHHQTKRPHSTDEQTKRFSCYDGQNQLKITCLTDRGPLVQPPDGTPCVSSLNLLSCTSHDNS